MKTPPFLIGASLLFWGWQIGIWPLGAALAAIAEGSRLMKAKWDLKPSDFNRIADLCTLIFVTLLITFYFSRRSAGFILILLQWLPVTFLPILCGQLYSTSDRVDISALFLTLRKRQRQGKKSDARGMAIDLTYPYFGVCVLSASAANMRTPWFYLGLFALSAWAIWPCRSTRYPTVVWIGLMIVIGITGYAGQDCLHRLQLILEDKALDWFAQTGPKEGDPYRARTSIGDIGLLKPSDRILFRAEWDSGLPSLLLRDATYNTYKASAWLAREAAFRPLAPDGNGKTWKVGSGVQARKLTVHLPLKGGKGMVKLPMGTGEITGPQGMKISMNRYGAVKVEEGPGMVSYLAGFGSGLSPDSPPDENDLLVPDAEKETISRVASALQVKGLAPKEIMGIIRAFFQEKFRYSLALVSEGGAGTPLGDFLQRSRSGHCEYFATATVLLLREAGIPARYATGYSVHEFSDLEKKFLVRERHAHAWAIAYVDGTWHQVDTTPASWTDSEAAASSRWLLSDLWSWGMFKVSEWRWQEGDQGRGWVRHLTWLLAFPVLFLIWRIRTRGRGEKEMGKEKGKGALPARAGMDSGFYLIEKRLADIGYPRQPWESFSSWIERVAELVPSLPDRETIDAALRLHYRYRFDPVGLADKERRLLNSRVRACLAELEKESRHRQ